MKSVTTFFIFWHVLECKRRFKTAASYKKHNARNHGTNVFFSTELAQSSAAILNSQLTHTEREINENIEYAEEGAEENCDSYEMNTSKQYEPKDQTYYTNNFKKHFASFILNIKEKHILPDVVQETLISELMHLVTYTEEFYKCSIRKGLVELGASPADSETFSDLVSEGTAFHQQKIQLDTKYKLKKYVEKCFPFVGAREYMLSCHDQHSK